MLRKDQIDDFKRDGVLILRGLFARDEVVRWHDQVVDYFERPASSQAWWKALTKRRPSEFRLSGDPTPNTHPALTGVYSSLRAGTRWSGENDLIVRPGDDEAPWLGAHVPHLDFPLHAPLRTLANIVTYLADVHEHGGAFMYWPGSHHIAWDHFRRHPDDYLSRGERSQDQTFDILRRQMTRDPVEFVGNAGDVLVWNSLLLHSGSVNKSHQPRIAIFGRWGVLLENGPIYEFDTDMWTYWNFAEVEVVGQS